MRSVTERVYDFISGEAEPRACKEIPEDACTAVPKNFVRNAASGTASKLAEQLAGPELVLPWLLAAIGAPPALTGLLVPVRQAGSLVPQLAVAGQIRKAHRRKWFWSGGATVQAIALVLMWPAVIFLPSTVAGWSVVVLLTLFSLASGVGSVAFSDVVGKTIPKGRRGLLLAVRATSGGILGLAAGFLIKSTIADSNSLTPYIAMIVVASGLWLIAALLFGSIAEKPGAASGGRNPLQELKAGVRVLRQDRGFAGFVLARVFLLTVELSLPFYALFARQFSGGELSNLGLFLMATALAEIFSSPFWGKFADRASHKVMAAGGLLAAAAGVYALLLTLLPGDLHISYLAAAAFLIVGFAKGGVRMGRKTYIIDYAPGDQRPLYTAMSNTLIGLLALAGGIFGLIAQLFGINVVIAVLLALALTGALIARALPEPEKQRA
jgi:MFS family permease